MFDISDSEESIDAFGATPVTELMPVLGALGIDAGEPWVAPVHNLIEG